MTDLMTDLIVRDTFPIGGEWVQPASDATLNVVSPVTEQIIGRIPMAHHLDVDRAVAAARAALPGWSALTLGERQQHMDRVADVYERRADELTGLLAMEIGCPVSFGRYFQVGLGLMHYRNIGRLAEEVDWVAKSGNATVVRQPIGVVAAITPWNYPQHLIASKIAWAMMAGCTVVLKPSEFAPLNAYLLAEIFDEAGLPPGVFNLITGDGPVVGEALVGHPGVDMVTFTGSSAVGRRIQKVAADSPRIKPVGLELGGKSANILLEDADLDRAIPLALQWCFVNTGQTCIALTRLLVPRPMLPEVEQRLAAAAAQIPVGDPGDPATVLGPLASERQRERVLGYIRTGIDEGARLIAGGLEPPEGLETGYYVKPTIFSDVTPTMRIATEEIFGPVLAVIPYDTPEEAITIANATEYGLYGSVWSRDENKAIDVALQIETGTVEVNGPAINPMTAFGGVKNSGHGRELGRWGFDEFTYLKSIAM
jgi:acyl-CoA reductase-like NAD-dependent aldehyde dehydrogenase